MTEVHTAPLPAAVLDALAAYDTPTICNALEVVAPHRRLTGFTTRPLVCPFPDLPPIVGYARTATIRATAASGRPAAEQQAQEQPRRTMRTGRADRQNGCSRHLGPRRPGLRQILGPAALAGRAIHGRIGQIEPRRNAQKCQ